MSTGVILENRYSNLEDPEGTPLKPLLHKVKSFLITTRQQQKIGIKIFTVKGKTRILICMFLKTSSGTLRIEIHT